MADPGKVQLKSGKVYAFAVFRVMARDAQGRPTQLELLHEDQSYDLRQGNVFITGYVSESALQPKPRADA